MRKNDRLSKNFVIGVIAVSLLGYVFSLWSQTQIQPKTLFLYTFFNEDTNGLLLMSGLFIMLYFVDVTKVQNVLAIFEKTGFVALVMSVVLIFAHFFIYQSRPFLIDETCFQFQSEIFASGKLLGNWPYELRNALFPKFYYDHFLVIFPDGSIFSRYWPGYSLLRAPFTWLAVPWLLNILLAVGCLYSTKAVLRRLFPNFSQAGAWGTLFLLASPSFLVNAISFFPNTFYVFSSLTFVALILKPTGRRLIAAGLLGSVAVVQHQPMPHTLFVIPWFCWLLFQEKGFQKVVILFVSYLPIGLLVGLGWSLWMLDIGTPNKLGLPADTISEMLSALPAQISDETKRFVHWIALYKIWVWSMPGLMLLAAIGFWKSSLLPVLRYFGYSAALTLIGYGFVPYDSGHGWGYRYFECAWPALVILGVGALCLGRNFLSEQNPTSLQRKILSAALLSFLIWTPYHLVNAQRLIYDQEITFPDFQEDASIEIAFVNAPLSYQQRKHDNLQNHPLLASPKIVMIGKGDLYIKHFMTKNFPNFQKRTHDPQRYYLPFEMEKEIDLSPLERFLVKRIRRE